ncbi:30S ribosomal protein S6--L-glutamate ligase [Crocinitomix catalasitica]|uniref:30S ribosomal protein S6--L-glutamate ligase n=1 Tax=Crocinitomix catalasitica TaxID=184607 RepID=UPI0004898FD7|nr:30S ribosomal protein S6--L-glutamate ligase [Crocinitomix catalasitica]
MDNYSNLTVIGSEEWCAFEDLGTPAIRARIDSGAQTSSIHASDIEPFIKNGEEWVRFEIHPLRESRKVIIKNECPVVAIRKVKNTGGVSERRYVIKTKVTIGQEKFEIELTLANRDAMGFRMLLGREAMNERFLVDPSATYLLADYTDSQIHNFYKSVKKLNSGLKIGLLASNRELYSNKRIIEAGEERGHTITFLNIEHCFMKMDATQPEVRYRGGSILEELDAIIPRLRPSMTHYGCALVRQFESMGTYCLNEAASISRSRDKLFSSQIFAMHGINVPITGFAKSPQDTKGLIEMVSGAPLIVKLLESTQGKGVVLAETNKAAESVINAFKSLNANILVQEFIKEAGGKDIRCFVIDNKVVASIQREAQKGEFRSNIHMGGKASVIRITAEERRLAIKAAKVLNLPIAGVDIIRSNKGPMVLEVNSSPGLEGIEGATGIDIAGLMIGAIEKKLKYERK